MSKQYSLYKRNNSPCYYVQFRQLDGKRSNPVSTGEKNKGRAEKKAIEMLMAGDAVSSDVTFREYSRDFFNWNGRWALDKRSKGKRLSPRQCSEYTKILENSLVHVFGKLKIHEISRQLIDAYRNDLYLKNYAGGTINIRLIAISQILRFAEDDGLIDKVPRIDKVSSKPKKRRGRFEEHEIPLILAYNWKDKRCYLANSIAFSTGMRAGEILALCREDIDWTKKSIFVHRSYDYNGKVMNETTKNGESRVVFPTQWILDLLSYYLETHDSDFLFPSFTSSDKPMGRDILRNSLYRVMDKVGIDADVRGARNLTFHSWRHSFNSILVDNNISPVKIMALTGHKDPGMMKHYYHLSSNDMKDVTFALDKVFEPGTKLIEH